MRVTVRFAGRPSCIEPRDPAKEDGMQWDFGDVDETEDFASLPAGWYTVKVEEVREGTTREGDARWGLKLVVVDGPFAGRIAAWDGVVWSERGSHRAKRLLEALAFDVEGVVELEPTTSWAAGSTCSSPPKSGKTRSPAGANAATSCPTTASPPPAAFASERIARGRACRWWSTNGAPDPAREGGGEECRGPQAALASLRLPRLTREGGGRIMGE